MLAYWGLGEIHLEPELNLELRICVMKKWTKPTIENRRLGFEINLYIQTR